MSTSRKKGIQNTNKTINHILSTCPIPQVTLSHDFFKVDDAKVSLSDHFKLELQRTPKGIYLNPAQKNETHSQISRIISALWLDIFSYLDTSTLVIMMISCKKMANLTNDDKVRERLYLSKQYHLFTKRTFSFIDETPELTIASLSDHLSLPSQAMKAT